MVMKITSGFKNGWFNAKKFYSITGKYKKKCKELDEELSNEGLTRETWKKFAFGRDLSLYGIGYSLAGLIFFVSHGQISKAR